MSRHSDRNLLLGVLALQMDFVSRDQLLSAMNTWLLQKQRPLSELLMEQGSLSPANEQLLRQLVDAHLAAHSDNARKSLAASIRMTDLAEALRAMDDEELQQTVAGVSASPSAAAPVVGSASSVDGRFVVVRPHAAGGLGEVSVAVDRELNREVALKLVHEQLAGDPEACRRFRVEAEVTGGLEHPGIVPVYGMGSTDDGRPFYAMRFIRGMTLQDAVQAFHANRESRTDPRYPAFRNLLRRFIDVCDAVSYAHSRGVLHRDLKPGNIMLGPFGETLVVDWGLARVRSGAEPAGFGAGQVMPVVPAGGQPFETQSGDVMGTVSYMSPEQACGDPDRLSERSDVYSLGAILFEVLTGQAAVCKVTTADGAPDLAEMLHNVRQGRVRSAVEVSPAASRSLSAVCARAMQFDPALRYGSAAELAADVERWLADESVSAFRESLPVRAARWTRRHQTFAVSAVVALAVGAAAAAGFGLVVAEKNAALRTANRDLDFRNEELRRSIAREQESRLTAQQNEAIAREQSQLTLATLTSVINDLQQGLRNVAGAGDVRRRLLNTSLEKLADVAAPFLEKAAVDRSVATAMLDMGDVLIQFGAGQEISPVPSISEPDSESAVLLGRRFYERAHHIAQTLADSPPAGSDATTGVYDTLATACSRMATTSLMIGQPDSAREWCRRSIAAAEKAAEETADADASVAICTAFCQLGDICLIDADLDAARQAFETARQHAEQALTLESGSTAARRALSVCCSRLGNVELRAGRYDEAIAHYQRDFETSQALAGDDPDNRQLQRDLFVSGSKVAEVLYRAGRPADAVAPYRDVLMIAERMLSEEPGDHQLQRDVAVICGLLGDVLLLTGDADGALPPYERAHELVSAMAESDPANAAVQRDLSISHDHLGDAALAQGRHGAAIQHFTDSRRIREQLAATDSSAQAQTDVVISIYKIGEAQKAGGDPQGAAANFRTAVEILNRLRQDSLLLPEQEAWIPEIEAAIRSTEQTGGNSQADDAPENVSR